MNCERFEALLADYLEGTLSKEDAAAMEKHQAECPACAQSLADMRMLLQDLDSLDSSAQVPAEWMQGWREAIYREEKANMQTQTAEAQKKRPWRAWVSAAAAIVVLTAGSIAARDLVPATSQPQANTRGAVMKQSASESYDLAEVSPGDQAMYGEPVPMPEMGAATARSSLGYAASEDVQFKAEAESGAGKTANGVKIIRTASYSLATMSFGQDLEAIKALTASYGGWVEYSDVTGDATRGDIRYASLTLRIPTQNLQSFQTGVTKIGRVTSLSESASDVSENYSDTQMRLATQKEKMDRLQKLMATTGELADLLAVENEIANTQYQIDSLESSLRGMDSRVDYTSIQVYLREETAGEAASVQNLTLGERILKGLSATWEAIVAFAQDMAVFLVMVLPVALPLFAAIFIVIKVRKHRKQTKQQ